MICAVGRPRPERPPQVKTASENERVSYHMGHGRRAVSLMRSRLQQQLSKALAPRTRRGGVFSPADGEIENPIHRRRQNALDWNSIFDPDARPHTVDPELDGEPDFLK